MNHHDKKYSPEYCSTAVSMIIIVFCILWADGAEERLPFICPYLPDEMHIACCRIASEKVRVLSRDTCTL